MRAMLHRSVPALILTVLLGSCASSSKPPAPAMDQAAAEAVMAGINQKFAAAVAARDTDQVVGFYADDAHLLPANAPRADGHDAIRAAWVPFLRTPGLSLTPTSTQVIVSAAGDLLIDVGSYRMTMDGPKGKPPIVDVGKYVTVYRKSGADWKVIVDTFNSDRPAPGM